MLPTKDRNLLVNSIKRIYKNRKIALEAEWNSDKIGLSDLILSDIYNHFAKYEDQIVTLKDVLSPVVNGCITYTVCGVDFYHETIEDKLGFSCPRLIIDDDKLPLSEKVRDLWGVKQQHFKIAESQYIDVTALAGAVINNFGSVKYLLTQFPELNAIFKVDLKGWKPNPHYRVPARNVFMNRDAFIHFLGGCTMDGVKL